MKLYKGSLLSVAAAVVLGLSGCGGSSDSSTNDSTNTDTTQEAATITGKAVDGYLQEAIVCLDLDLNDNCNITNEPTTNTDANGSYTLTITPEQQNHPNFAKAPIIVYGGIDSDTGKRFEGFLKAPNDGSAINITPLTTMVQKQVEEQIQTDANLTKDLLVQKVQEAELKLKKILQIPDDIDLSEDPIALHKNGNSELIKAALSVQKTAETLAKAAASDSNTTASQTELVDEVYAALAKGVAEVNTSVDANATGIELIVEKATPNLPQKAQEVKDIAVEIGKKAYDLVTEVGDEPDGLEKVATILQQDITKVENALQDENITDINITSVDEIVADDYDYRKESLAFEIQEVLQMHLDQSELDLLLQKIPSDFQAWDLYERTEELKDIPECKDLYDRIIQVKQSWEQQTQEEIAQTSAPATLTLPETFYDFYIDMYGNTPEFKMDITTLNPDLSFTSQEYLYDINSSTWVVDRDDQGLVLTPNGWVVENSDSGVAILNEDGTYSFPDSATVKIVGPIDIAGAYTIPNGETVTMPEGAKQYTINVVFSQQYRLWDVERNWETGEAYSSFEAFMQNQCDNAWFDGDNNGGISFGDCNSIGDESGTLYIVENRDENGSEVVSTNGGTWEFREVYGEKILVILPNEAAKQYLYNDDTRIFALYNGVLYRGGIDQDQSESFYAYNKEAADVIKSALSSFVATMVIPNDQDVYDENTSQSNSYDTNTTSATPDQNSTNSIISMIAGKTFYTSIDDRMETLEEWTFSTDGTTLTWRELVGGNAESGTATVSVGDDNVSLIIEDSDGRYNVQIDEIYPDHIDLNIDGVIRTIFEDRYAASAYFGVVADVDLSTKLLGKTFYVVGYDQEYKEYQFFKASVNDAGDTLTTYDLDGNELHSASVSISGAYIDWLDDGSQTIAVEVGPNYITVNDYAQSGMDGYEGWHRIYENQEDAQAFYDSLTK